MKEQDVHELIEDAKTLCCLWHGVFLRVLCLISGIRIDFALKSFWTYQYADVCTCYERFLLKGNFTYSGSGSFGLCFDYNGEADKYKLISICPDDNILQLSFNEGTTPIAETEIHLEPGKDYAFTYIQEGSVGVFYIDGMAALTVRLYGVSGKPVRLFAQNNSVTFSALEQYSN